MNIQDLYKYYCESYLVDTDTRKIRKNSIFFALKGENFNGNAFVQDALKKGARYCVIDEQEFFIEGKTILVDDVLKSLQSFANYHRRQLNLPIVALTGSNGKTTTKELINEVLSTQYRTKATVGNFNNHIGVPLTLLSFNPETEIGIVEMGANHQKEIEFLCSIAEPDYGYITNFGKAHLEGFGGVKGVVKGKSELYHFLSKNSKTIFVNEDDEKQKDITKGMSNIVYVNDKETKLLTKNPFLEIDYKSIKIKTQLVGEYNFKNIRAAISIGDYFNIDSINIKNAIENYIPKNNRSQIIKLGTNTILLDAYNANPSSMEAALNNFNTIDHPRKIVILGDMFELGFEASTEHQNIANLANNLDFHKVYFVGENFFSVKTGNKFSNFEEFINFFTSKAILDSYLLIKGSRGMALERVLKYIS